MKISLKQLSNAGWEVEKIVGGGYEIMWKRNDWVILWNIEKKEMVNSFLKVFIVLN